MARKPRKVDVATNNVVKPKNYRRTEIDQMHHNGNRGGRFTLYAQRNQSGRGCGVKSAGGAARRWHQRTNQ